MKRRTFFGWGNNPKTHCILCLDTQENGVVVVTEDPSILSRTKYSETAFICEDCVRKMNSQLPPLETN